MESSKISIIQGAKKNIPSDVFYHAAKLRHDSYVDEGFITKRKDGMLRDEYDEHAMHFIALHEGKAIGCLSLVWGKLPLEQIFGDEKKELMKKFNAGKAVELSRFAIDKKYRIGNNKVDDYGKFVSFHIFRKVYKYIFRNKIDLILITVNPKYVERYQNRYRFHIYGKQKSYPRVKNNPAVLMYQTRKDIYILGIRNIFMTLFLIRK